MAFASDAHRKWWFANNGGGSDSGGGSGRQSEKENAMSGHMQNQTAQQRERGRDMDMQQEGQFAPNPRFGGASFSNSRSMPEMTAEEKSAFAAYRGDFGKKV